MPLGIGTTVDYIFFSAESCENGNRTGKPGGSRVPHESLGQLMVVRHLVAWLELLGFAQQKSRFLTYLALSSSSSFS